MLVLYFRNITDILEDYDVYENIILALQLQQKEINESEVDKLLERLELTDLKTRKVNELSGGQKQRVAIARALIKNPQVLIGDEITKPLDVNNSRHVLNILKKINQTYHTSIIIVTHDKFIASLASRVIYLKNGLINTN